MILTRKKPKYSISLSTTNLTVIVQGVKPESLWWKTNNYTHIEHNKSKILFSTLTTFKQVTSYCTHFWAGGELLERCWSANIVGVVGGVKDCSDDTDSRANLRFFNGVT